MLMLIRKEWMDGTPVEMDHMDVRSINAVTRIHELNFEINDQMDHVRESSMATPLLVLPTIVQHVVDEKSPFYPMNPEKFYNYEFELVAVLDGVDEAVSNNVQARWSYVPEEFIWNHTFVNIIEKNKKYGRYVVDYSKFNRTMSIPENFVSNIDTTHHDEPQKNNMEDK